MEHQDSSFPSSVADLAALGKLLEDHRPRLLAMLRRRIDPALAARIDPEDIINDAFLLARRKWSRFRSQSTMSPYAWLYGIVRDCLINAWRRHTRSPRNLAAEVPWPERSSIELGLGLVSPGTSPSEAAARAELQERMRQALAMLKESDREILWMRHYDQLTFAEAAELLGLKESAATLRYVRALERLKRLWRELNQEEGSTG